MDLVIQNHDDVEKKQKCLEQSIKVDPDSGEAHSNLCLLLYGKGEYQEGLKHAKKAISLITTSTPRKIQAVRYNNLSLCLSALGKKKKAIEIAQRALDINPEDHNIRSNIRLYQRADQKRTLKRKTIGYIVAIAILVISCMVCFTIPSQDEPTSSRQPTPAIVPVLARVQDANGYDWRSATRSDRIELCKWMDDNQQAALGASSSVGWQFLFNGLNAFYQSDDPLILEQKITEVAAVLVLSSSE